MHGAVIGILAGLAATAVITVGMLAFRVASTRVSRLIADRAHARLVAEARNEWSLVRSYKIECQWSRDGKPNDLAGWVILHAEQNSLGERRVRVIHKPDGWLVNGMHIYAQLADWATQAEVRSLPRPDRVPAWPS